MSGGQWSAKWENTNSTKCMHLLQRLVSIGAAPQSIPSSDSRVGVQVSWCALLSMLKNAEVYNKLHFSVL